MKQHKNDTKIDLYSNYVNTIVWFWYNYNYFISESYHFEIRIIFDSRNTWSLFLSGSSSPIKELSLVIRFNLQACKTIEMKTLNINESIQIKKWYQNTIWSLTNRKKINIYTIIKYASRWRHWSLGKHRRVV